jgi:dTDP-L-rhamnose 4-epimerase
MKHMRVLVTGGAGFIGTHLVRRFLEEGCEVTVVDNFSPQVHGERSSLPADMASHVRLIRGDVRNSRTWCEALPGQETVVHLAAETGTGQSMYEITRYQEVNIGGTAHLFDHLVSDHARSVSRIIVASSRAVYGEGAYSCYAHGRVYPCGRKCSDIKAGILEPRCPICGEPATAVPTTEDSPLSPTSYYGLTKQVQEQTALLFARTLGLSAVALRYQNVYGPGQSLNNPYTGILAIFSNLASVGRPIQVFEDGRESRDFVHVEDVVNATLRATTAPLLEPSVFNVGSGHSTTVFEVAHAIKSFLASASTITVTGAFRDGDIRHNVADISAARIKLDYTPKWDFKRGVQTFLEWARAQPATPSTFEATLSELHIRGLLHV